jgi:integrase
MAKLTDIGIRALKPPVKGQQTFWDEHGLGIRVSQGGTKTWVLVHGSQRERITIGRYPILSLQDARAVAKKFLAEKTLGKRDNPTLRFEDALAVFLETQTERLKPSTKRDYTRILKSHFEKSLRSKPLTEIKTHHLTSIIDKLHKTPAEANYAFAVARRFFRWSVTRRYISHSPLEGIGLPTKTPSRERVLSPEELKEVWNKSGDGNFGAIIRLCIILGQRRGEIAALHSSWIDREKQTITFPTAIMKNRLPHTIPFPDIAKPYLLGDGLLFPARGRDTLFSGWSKAKAALDKRLGETVEPFTIHDIRRSVATIWASLNIEPHIVEALLSHLTFRQGVQGTYNRFRYLPQMREAIAKYENYLIRLLAG